MRAGVGAVAGRGGDWQRLSGWKVGGQPALRGDTLFKPPPALSGSTPFGPRLDSFF